MMLDFEDVHARAFCYLQTVASQIQKPDALVLVAASATVFLVLELLVPKKGKVGKAADKVSLPVGRGRQTANPKDSGHAGCDWAGCNGRYKHCALRSDPFAPDASPPKYSLVNLDLPVPPLAPGEEEKLQAFEEEVADLTSAGRRTDRATLLRFLRARKGDVNAADAYFRKALEYRDSLDLHEMETTWNLDAYDGYFLPWWVRGGIIGHGLNGEIVGFERFGESHFPELLRSVPWPVMQRLDASHMVRTLAAFEEDALRTQRPLGNAILVIDLQGVGWKDMSPQVARAYGKIVSYRDMLMPNTLKNILLIRAPAVFATGWSMVSAFLDPVTRDKVQIVSGAQQSLALLRRYLSNDIIPAYLGGGRSIEGDPECKQLLGNSGPVPREAVTRLLELVAEGPGRCSLPDASPERTPTACCFCLG